MTNKLSAMQEVILNYYADGMSAKQIAFELDNSERTVQTHTATIKRKLGTENIAHAVAIYARAGLLYINQRVV